MTRRREKKHDRPPARTVSAPHEDGTEPARQREDADAGGSERPAADKSQHDAGSPEATKTAPGSPAESAGEAASPSEGADAAAEQTPADAHAALSAECDQLREKWLRALAELDNLRKRSRREVDESRRFAQAEVLRAFLDIQDNLERALQSTGGDADTDSLPALREGVELIYQRFRAVLQERGVEPIDALGAHFDPAVHEAVGQVAREGVEPGLVVEVAQAGFRFADMVLRPARVIISA